MEKRSATANTTRFMLMIWLAAASGVAQTTQAGPPAPPKGSISGVVADTSGSPVADVDVCVNCNSSR